MFSHETAPFDEPIRAWMLDHQTSGVRRLFLVVTHAASPMSIIPVTAAAAMWLRATCGLPIAGAVVLAPTVAGLASALSTVPTLLIGTSRVYVDVHWSTDVLGGWSLDALVTTMSALVYEQLRSDTRAHGAAVTRHG